MIRFEDVTKAYKGDVVALRELSLEILKGEFVFLVGPSGSGKSTFLKLLLRDEVATGGKVLVAGRDIGRLGSWKVPQLRRNIGCVFQDFKLLTNKTVYENVAFALEVIGRPKHIVRTQVPQILDLVGLTKKADNFPTELSGGEQQRVSIARAFVNRPLILLADEPTGNLDPATTVGIMRLLDRINRTGTTVVMATHDQRIVDAMRRRGSSSSTTARSYATRCAACTGRQLMSRLAYFVWEGSISLRPQPPDDDRRHHHRRDLAVPVRRDPARVGDGRSRHPAVEARHRARDLHEGRRDAHRGADDRDALKTNPQVKSYKYLSQQDAYNIFKKDFADQPAFVESTKPSDLPESFRVAPVRAEDTRRWPATYKGSPGRTWPSPPAEADQAPAPAAPAGSGWRSSMATCAARRRCSSS